jgi:PAS domain-containing protein
MRLGFFLFGSFAPAAAWADEVALRPLGFVAVLPEAVSWLCAVSAGLLGVAFFIVFTVWRRTRAVVDRQARELASARARLTESAERFETLFENAIEGVYESTQADGICAVNPALARIFGFNAVADFLAWAQPDLDALYVRPERRTEFLASLASKDTLLDFESEVRCRDGTTKWISESVWARRSADGQVRRLHRFVSDITARRSAENALRESEERYRTLFEHSPVAVFEFDYRGVAQ